jgi:hypothetical protein
MTLFSASDIRRFDAELADMLAGLPDNRAVEAATREMMLRAPVPNSAKPAISGSPLEAAVESAVRILAGGRR